MKLERVSYGGWPNCVRITAGEVDLIATTDVGPRIIRWGFVNGPNVMKEYADHMGKVGGDEWRLYGGHRLWHAPEAKPRTYVPDNGPVAWEWDGFTLRLKQPVEAGVGIEKHIEITPASDGREFRVLHRLINRNCWDIETAPWCLTVTASGGRFIAPHEPFRSHDDYLLPSRPLVLWHYTDMSDPRWVWGRRYIQLIQDTTRDTPQKLGFLNRRGWVAVAQRGLLFVKRYEAMKDATYPDYGANTEVFTNADMLEVETLGPLSRLAAHGGSAEHVERWLLCRADFGDFHEDTIERVLGAAGIEAASP